MEKYVLKKIGITILIIANIMLLLAVLITVGKAAVSITPRKAYSKYYFKCF